MKLIPGPPVRFKSVRPGAWFIIINSVYTKRAVLMRVTLVTDGEIGCNAVVIFDTGDQPGVHTLIADDELVRIVVCPEFEIDT